ncbi:hypothetical protein BD779DRAFT_1804498 [Infundibulicybe gibba]|nr:hypothetical protein BD779DRAFT_1804498 [Infundibulicybe gibba]
MPVIPTCRDIHTPLAKYLEALHYQAVFSWESTVHDAIIRKSAGPPRSPHESWRRIDYIPATMIDNDKLTTGSAFEACYLGQRIHLHSHSSGKLTSNGVEMIAMSSAIEWAALANAEVVYSDSLFALSKFLTVNPKAFSFGHAPSDTPLDPPDDFMGPQNHLHPDTGDGRRVDNDPFRLSRDQSGLRCPRRRLVEAS